MYFGNSRRLFDNNKAPYCCTCKYYVKDLIQFLRSIKNGVLHKSLLCVIVYTKEKVYTLCGVKILICLCVKPE